MAPTSHRPAVMWIKRPRPAHALVRLKAEVNFTIDAPLECIRYSSVKMAQIVADGQLSTLKERRMAYASTRNARIAFRCRRNGH